MIAVLCVALGSAVGAPLRYLVDRGIQGRTDRVFPFGTLVINVSGALLLGALTAAGDSLPALAVTALGIGLLGAFTTFSTLVWETLRMLEEGSVWEAAVNVTASIGLGLLAAAAGYLLVSAL